MSEQNGSAEKQAQRMDERAAEAGAQKRRKGERYEMVQGEATAGPIRRLAHRVRANPAAPVLVGLALIAASAAAIAIRNQRTRPGLRSLRRRARAAVEAFQEPTIAIGPRAFAILARLAAIGLAGLTWRRVRAIGRDRFD